MSSGASLHRVALAGAVATAGCAGEDASQHDGTAPTTEVETGTEATDETGDETEEETEEGTDETDTGGTDEIPDDPYCCGCLCADPMWSCSEDTCVTEEGLAIGLEREAGFIEIEDGEYEFRGTPLHSPRHRVWYSFQPALDSPEDAPLVLFFNGGPGSSTAPLFGFNTGEWSFDTEGVGGSMVENESDWRSFANLLYVDAPATGFSYVLPTESGAKPAVAIDPDRDAATTTRVLLRFLARHPDLRDAPIIIAGESYGGVRGSLMMAQLLAYESLDDDGAEYYDPELVDELREHFAATRPETEGTGLSAAEIAEQFGHLVVIQGLVTGTEQATIGNALVDPPPAYCVADYDAYQCDEASGYMFGRMDEVAQRVVDPELFETALGIDPTTIEWMYASERTEAYARQWQSGNYDLSQMTEIFGTLPASDSYFLDFNTNVTVANESARDAWDPDVGRLFLYAAYFADVLITDAAFDLVLWSPAIPIALGNYPALIDASIHDTEPREGVERPGWIQLTYHPDVVPGDPERELRMPHYANSGHMVTLRESSELREDVAGWFAQSR